MRWTVLLDPAAQDEPEQKQSPASLHFAAPLTDTVTLERAVIEAVRAWLGDKQTPEVIVANIMLEEEWAFGTVAIPAQTPEGGPEGFLFLGRSYENGWQIALSGQPEFEAWRDLAPDGFPLIRGSAFSAQSVTGDGSAQLGFPWAVGESWTMTGGPHTNAGYVNGQPDWSRPRSALDFAGGTGIVRPARDGRAYRPCADFVLVDHGDGWFTGYYHLANIPIAHGAEVQRWTTALGNISTNVGCGGRATGAHVHFTLRYGAAHGHVELHGKDIGGWTIQEGNAPYSGCLVRGNVYRCENQQVYNDGQIGSGSTPPPSCPQSGGVILYQHAHYDCGGAGEGTGYVIRGGSGFQVVPNTFDNRASSIRIPSNWSVRLFEHSTQNSPSACINAPGDSDFSDNRYPDNRSINDTISSFEVFTSPNCGGNSGGTNRPPNTPSPSSPHDWYVARDGRAPTLCWNNPGDPDGDAVQFFAEVFQSARNAQSGWTYDTCWRPAELDGGYFSYQWRVKARDARGAESSWSTVWHFSIEQGPQPPSTSWQASYWDNRELRGGPRVQTNEGGVYLFHKWDWGAPHGLPGDNWSARFVKRTYFPGGWYSFHCHHDDGCRVYVDGRLIIDAWWDSSFDGHDGGTHLAAGEHEVKVEYYEKTGFAGLEVWWRGPGYLPEGESCDATATWCGEYWGNRDLMGTPAIQRREGSSLSLHWGVSGPHSTFPTDQFSSRFWRTPYFECGRYRFHVFADDGVRMWVDDVLRLNEWRDQVAGFSFDLDLSEGRHHLRAEHYENGGSAAIEIGWQKLNSCPPQVIVEEASTHYVKGGQPVEPLVRVRVTHGMLDGNRGDALVWTGGAWLNPASGEQTVYRPVYGGEQHLFNTFDYPTFRMTAPGGEGTYESVWQMRAAGANVGSPAVIRVVVDNTPPNLLNLNVTQPNPNTFQLILNATDAVGVDSVRFVAGYHTGNAGWQWRPLGWDANGADGWSWTWDVSSIPDQAGIAFYAEAWDRAGNSASHVVADIILDRVAPQTALRPLSATQESTAFILAWDGTDSVSGIERFEFEVQQGAGAWEYLGWADGNSRRARVVGTLGQRYRFRMRGVDRAGNVEAYPTTAEAETYINLCNGDAYEPDNDRVNAKVLNLGAPQRHTFCGLNDQDWVVFWAERGRHYVILTRELAQTDSFRTDTVLTLYGPDGALIAENDDWGNSLASFITWTPTTSGWHAAKLRQWDGHLIAGNAVAYTLSFGELRTLYMPHVVKR
ncbi:MAG: PA14 domain-containing protein [Anaerolineae bacterium]|nr:PA14 domain-containing protein [Anaerolineae bacterium]